MSSFVSGAFIHTCKYWLGIDSAATQTTAAERDAIRTYAAGKKRAVEIGVFQGVTTGVIAKSLSDAATLFAVDPFPPGRMGICWGKLIAKREAFQSQPACNIEFVEDFSHVAAERLTGDFDFIFVDGDHSREGIIRDWNDWAPRVAKDGIIALHDSLVPDHNPNVANLGSHQYFVETIQHDKRFEVVHQVDSLAVLRCKAD
ncbi:MAG: class I SAM-dependent methyltransferase [Planctomycetota bacterium]